MNEQAKVVGETITVTFSFMPTFQLYTLTSPVCSVVVLSGVDEDPDDLLEGSPTVDIDTCTVTQKIARGTPGVVYGLICDVEIDTDVHTQVQITLAILSGTGSFDPGTAMTIDGDLPATFCVDEELYETLEIVGGYEPFGDPEIISGSLPPGVVPFVSGNLIVFGGIPTGSLTSYSFTVQLEDFVGNIATSSQTIEVIDCTPLGIFLTLGGGAKAYVSDEAGDNWTERTDPSVQVEFRHCASLPGGIVAATLSTGATNDVYYSDDFFETATVSASGPFAGNSFGRCDTGTRMVFGMWNGTTIYTIYSDDDGVTWTQGANISTGTSQIPTDLSYGLGYYVVTCSAPGLDPGLLAVSADLSSWSTISTDNFDAVGFNGTGFLASKSTVSYLYTTTPAGAWASTGGTTPNLGLVIVGKSGYFLVGTYEGGVFKTVDNGAAFTLEAVSGNRYYEGAISVNNDVAVIGPGGGGGADTLSSIDAGDTWATTFTFGFVGLCFMRY